jgi:hypothetical protein
MPSDPNKNFTDKNQTYNITVSSSSSTLSSPKSNPILTNTSTIVNSQQLSVIGKSPVSVGPESKTISKIINSQNESSLTSIVDGVSQKKEDTSKTNHVGSLDSRLFDEALSQTQPKSDCNNTKQTDDLSK